MTRTTGKTGQQRQRNRLRQKIAHAVKQNSYNTSAGDYSAVLHIHCCRRTVSPQAERACRPCYALQCPPARRSHRMLTAGCPDKPHPHTAEGGAPPFAQRCHRIDRHTAGRPAFPPCPCRPIHSSVMVRELGLHATFRVDVFFRFPVSNLKPVVIIMIRSPTSQQSHERAREKDRPLLLFFAFDTQF